MAEGGEFGKDLDKNIDNYGWNDEWDNDQDAVNETLFF